jgi:predicted protein tyrosine phosphatase
MSKLDRYAIAANKHQGKFKKVLCVCTTGILRSATAAYLLSQAPYNYNTRAVGTSDLALIQLNPFLIAWADEILCFGKDNLTSINFMMHKDDETPVYVLDIEDAYAYRDPVLEEIIGRFYVSLNTED